MEISDHIPSDSPGWGVGFIGKWRGGWGGLDAPLPRGLKSGLIRLSYIVQGRCSIR